jgi:hypothetical protein
MSGLVYVAEDGQLVTCDPAGADWRRLTHPMDGASEVGWRTHQRSPGWSWPCPSPDGQTIAAFHHPSDPSLPAQLRLVDLDGVGERQILSLDDTLPVYLQWSPDGERVAALLQDGESLQLHGCHRHVLGLSSEIESGSPLFFQWIDRTGRVLVHVGDEGGDARILIRSLGDGEDHIIGQTQGVIAAPQLLNERVWLSVPSRRSTRFICYDPASGGPGERRSIEGWFQLTPGPEGAGEVLVGLDPSSQKRGLGLMDWGRGAQRWFDTGPPIAAQWLPDGAHILVAAIDSSRTAYRWLLVRAQTEEVLELARFWPTPDERLRLRFYSQFAHSHPRLSPDGYSLLYASYLDPEAKGSEMGEAYIHALDLREPGCKPELLDKGSLAVYLPEVCS